MDKGNTLRMVTPTSSWPPAAESREMRIVVVHGECVRVCSMADADALRRMLDRERQEEREACARMVESRAVEYALASRRAPSVTLRDVLFEVREAYLAMARTIRDRWHKDARDTIR
jgi:hypothetical protein